MRCANSGSRCGWSTWTHSGTDQGYRIPKAEYYLPDIEFAPEELAALMVAAQSGAGDSPAEHGMRKLLFGAEGGVLGSLVDGPLASGSDADSSVVIACADAASRHRKIRFHYRTAEGAGSEREVDAFAVVYRGGHWYLVGHDRDRDAVRAFRVSRLVGSPSDEGEGRPRPDGFLAAEHVRAGPWDAAAEDRASVAVAPDAVWRVRATLAGSTTAGTLDDGRMELSVPVPDEASVASLLLELGPDVEVLSPPSLRDEMVRRLEVLGG